MKEYFTRTVVMCAAASSFFGGAFVLGNSAVSVMDSRVQAAIAAQAKQEIVSIPAENANGR